MPRFRILHASDLHFSTRPFRYGLTDSLQSWFTGTYIRPGHTVSTHSPTVALALAAFAYRNRGAYDALLLSGDLGATGSAGDLGFAQRFLSAPPMPGLAPYAAGPTRSTLRSIGKPVVVLPGNHDRYGPLLSSPPYPPGDATFDAMFPSWSAGQGAQELWRHTRTGVTLVLLGADFTLRPSDLGGSGPSALISALPLFFSVWHYGRGRVYDEPLGRLRDLTRKVRQEAQPCVVLWAVHFEPETTNTGLELLGDQLLVQAAAEEHVPAILCGHTHRSRVRALAGGITTAYVCGTTAQYYVGPHNANAIHVLDIDTPADCSAPPTITCRRYTYDSVRKGFLLDPHFP